MEQKTNTQKLTQPAEQSAAKWRMTAIMAILIAVIAVIAVMAVAGSGNRGTDGANAKNTSGEVYLNLWNDTAEAKEKLIAYVESVTKEGSADYIPVENRIAVFDLDGTLFCETDPNYFDYTLLAYRVLEDEEYKGKASAFEREVAGKIKEQNETGASFSGLEVDHGKAVASAFSGIRYNYIR